jgi:hypothetical protein
MTRIVRNILVAFGAYYLSLWTAPLFSWPFDKLNVHFTYSGSLLSAVMMGVMTSMGRAVSATVAVAIVCVSADSETPERWAYIVAVLYVADASLRAFHWKWNVPPTIWDHLWLGVDRLFPAIACVIGAIVIAHYRRKKRLILLDLKLLVAN